jgi:hypothetical protein
MLVPTLFLLEPFRLEPIFVAAGADLQLARADGIWRVAQESAGTNLVGGGVREDLGEDGSVVEVASALGWRPGGSASPLA